MYTVYRGVGQGASGVSMDTPGIRHFDCIFLQKCSHYYKTFYHWYLSDTLFLSDSEMDWTPLIFELPNAPGFIYDINWER